MCCMKKRRTHIQLIFQNIIQPAQKNFLMIHNGKACHYLAVTKVSALLVRITSKHDSNFYCFNFLHSFATEDKLKSHEKYVNIKRIALPN